MLPSYIITSFAPRDANERFMDAKMIEGKVTGANVSVKVDDEFMNAVRENKKYTNPNFSFVKSRLNRC